MSWNLMGTITHDYSTPYHDRIARQYQRKKAKPAAKKPQHVFAANPLWKKAYAGRSEK